MAALLCCAVPPACHLLGNASLRHTPSHSHMSYPAPSRTLPPAPQPHPGIHLLTRLCLFPSMPMPMLPPSLPLAPPPSHRGRKEEEEKWNPSQPVLQASKLSICICLCLSAEQRLWPSRPRPPPSPCSLLLGALLCRIHPAEGDAGVARCTYPPAGSRHPLLP
eukprot:GGOE01028089.1.p1 GENE.GGOE01028089.1~~GGOE01028089.1.p1  ORF type:complete len:163 (-),score=10.65 GGOE01028089.1:39-527(-)